MGRCLLRAEGVNFGATMFDTNDISTIRGASLALAGLNRTIRDALARAGARNVEERFSGASQCLFGFEAPGGDAEAVATAVRAALLNADPKEPWRHLAVMVDALPAEDERAGERRLEARNKAQQLRRFSVPALPFSTQPRRPDPFEGIQPGTVPTRLPRGKVLGGAPGGEGAAAADLAPSVAARRRYGRTARQSFYRDELGEAAASVRVTESIQDIVHRPPEGLPLSVASKIAVVYADGNRFGAVRDAIGSPAFSTAIVPLRRALLGRIVAWLGSAPGDPALTVWDEADKPALRFETLLYGGDEFMVVLPAWLAASFVEGFFAHTAEWSAGGQRLTHAVGVAIAGAKTPIRQLRTIAKSAADIAKEARLRAADSVTFEVFESVAPPDTPLANLRTAQYGRHEEGALARRIALPGHAFAEARRLIARLKGEDGSEGFPRSQIYAALRAVRAQPGGAGFFSEKSDEAVEAALERYAARAGADRSVGIGELRLPGFEPRGRALDLALIAGLWDYADPLAGTGVAELSDF